MLDIKLLRSETERIRQLLSRRKENIDLDSVLRLDEERRDIIYKAEQLKAKQNETSKRIPQLKKQGVDTTALMQEMKEISNKASDLTAKLSELEQEIEAKMLEIPNIPHDSVPDGFEESDNVEIRRFGTPRGFEWTPLPHWELGENLDILDFSAGAKISGARFTVYKGLGARLERALINFFLDKHTQDNHYTEILPPFMVLRECMVGTGQLPKFEEDAFKVTDGNRFLIPTAEVPVTNLYRETILNGPDLPLKHVAYSACFRAEAGSAGRDTRGLIRQHQFNKVELVKFTTPEQSYDELEKLTRDAESVLSDLGLPYRVVQICVGDLGFTAAKKYDIEVWLPSYNRYVEISSCSNFEDFQARRAGIKFRRAAGQKAEYVHTLNGSGVAIGRCVAAILENFQNPDGTISVPQVLKKYMNTDTIARR